MRRLVLEGPGVRGRDIAEVRVAVEVEVDRASVGQAEGEDLLDRLVLDSDVASDAPRAGAEVDPDVAVVEEVDVLGELDRRPDNLDAAANPERAVAVRGGGVDVVDLEIGLLDDLPTFPVRLPLHLQAVGGEDAKSHRPLVADAPGGVQVDRGDEVGDAVQRRPGRVLHRERGDDRRAAELDLEALSLRDAGRVEVDARGVVHRADQRPGHSDTARRLEVDGDARCPGGAPGHRGQAHHCEHELLHVHVPFRCPGDQGNGGVPAMNVTSSACAAAASGPESRKPWLAVDCHCLAQKFAMPPVSDGRSSTPEVLGSPTTPWISSTVLGLGTT